MLEQNSEAIRQKNKIYFLVSMGGLVLSMAALLFSGYSAFLVCMVLTIATILVIAHIRRPTGMRISLNTIMPAAAAAIGSGIALWAPGLYALSSLPFLLFAWIYIEKKGAFGYVDE